MKSRLKVCPTALPSPYSRLASERAITATGIPDRKSASVKGLPSRKRKENTFQNPSFTPIFMTGICTGLPTGCTKAEAASSQHSANASKPGTPARHSSTKRGETGPLLIPPFSSFSAALFTVSNRSRSISG